MVLENQKTLKKTALNSLHHQLGAKMIPFCGWEMPVQYSSVIEEHCNVRSKVGIFDVSHMGEIIFKGPAALSAVQKLISNNAARLADGQTLYTGMLYPEGTFVDDLLVYRFAENHFMFCVNAANVEKDYQWILQNVSGKVQVENISDQVTQIAIQGPKAIQLVQRLTELDLSAIKYYWFGEGLISGKNAIISRTGYTGEDGFELYLDNQDSPSIWQALLEGGQDLGVQPIGLAARDTLRLEAKMALYGNDIDNTTTPLEADLAWTVKLKKGDFIGREALLKQNEEGIQRKLVGFEITDKGVARSGYSIYYKGAEISKVTSGSYAPWLKKSIGLAYLPIEFTEIGTEIHILIRNKEISAKVVETPFYKRP